MASPAKIPRRLISAAALGVVAVGLAAAFWPQAAPVDLGAVTEGPMMVTIDEEGRTRVSEPYVVSTPVAGRLQRVQVRPGDPVVRGETIVAHMLPLSPAALDIRTREQARAAVTAAEAALRVARADLNAALARNELAQSELDRTRRLAESEIAADAALQRADQSARVAQASVDTAEAAIAMREADLSNARALLIGFEDQALAAAVGTNAPDDIPLYAPSNGRILRVIQQSAITLPAGSPIVEIGDVSGDLEVVVDLLSTDAVRVREGDRAIIEDWGGAAPLPGRVARIDPFGVTKFSALGVEESRVAATVELTGPAEAREGLGHGYRVEARIVVWETATTLRVPSSALFQQDEGWAVFAVDEGRAVRKPVEIGPSDGLQTQLLGGLSAGETVVLYPTAAIGDGSRIAPR